MATVRAVRLGGVIAAVAMALAVASVPSAAQVPGDVESPGTMPELDLFVDGKKSRITPGIGAVAGNVYVNVLPEGTVGATGAGLASGATLVVAPLAGGDHVVGIGYEGFNAGIAIAKSTPGDVVRVFQQFGSAEVLEDGPLPCSGSGSIEIRSGAAKVTGLISSYGETFTRSDPTYVEMARSGTAVTRYAFEASMCEGAISLSMPSTRGIDAVPFFKMDVYEGSITRMPTALHVRQLASTDGWEDGYSIVAPGGFDGRMLGRIDYAGRTTEVVAFATGLERASVLYKTPSLDGFEGLVLLREAVERWRARSEEARARFEERTEESDERRRWLDTYREWRESRSARRDPSFWRERAEALRARARRIAGLELSLPEPEPFVRFGAAFARPGDSVRVLAGVDVVRAVETPDGQVRFENAIVEDHVVPAGTCVRAFLGFAEECHLDESLEH